MARQPTNLLRLMKLLLFQPCNFVKLAFRISPCSLLLLLVLEEKKSSSDSEFGIQNVRFYTYKELRSATEDFSLANKIGEGGFGSVYKGRLKDGKIAAIKVLSAESRQGVREFVTEIKTISEIEHENLVKLYGCCVEDNHRILVYNYLENNSLAQTLLGFIFKSYCVVKFRISPASCHLIYQAGYLAPEYAIRGQLTRKADIYGFGVLLIEIVSGRCNTNTQLPVGEQYLLERTWDLYERRELVGLVDTLMNGDFDAEEACRFLKVGLLCTQDTPKLRPTMSSVVKMLTGEKNVDGRTITKPGLISDFMDLKVRSSEKPHAGSKYTSSYNASSSSENLDNSTLTLSSGNSASATMTLSAPYDRSV
ncbi:hypothetical protein COLO4_07048 [Corchorus olitorius]|uniref:Protein kinase domain-containing protein n=1 Tax=Corchorus olitorius TaxID=93759 RepID=A0A1R3KL38_9ROSI|nr:hypothetical protein COLO4_07048 [Corchorus olitorius]